MAASGPVERLQQLESIEKDVANAILSAGIYFTNLKICLDLIALKL